MFTTEGAEICEDTRCSCPLNRDCDVEPLANDAGIIAWIFEMTIVHLRHSMNESTSQWKINEMLMNSVPTAGHVRSHALYSLLYFERLRCVAVEHDVVHSANFYVSAIACK